MENSGKPGASSSETKKKLADDLDRATSEFMRLERIASDIIRQVATGIPPPDGQFRITQATKKLKCAFDRYQIAVKRYRDFVDHGIQPQFNDASDPS